MAPRKKCLLCGSRQWRKNAMGLVTCSEGHVLQHYVNESEEADDVGNHMLWKRALKTNRKKNQRASRADPKLYHGDRARFHYYQCLQLLFRKQVAALIALWNLPPEFETICRDLWVLHLTLLPSPPPAEPFHYTREQEGYQREQPEEAVKRDRSRSRPENEVDIYAPEGTAPAPDESSSSEDETLAPEITVLLEENSEVGSSDDKSSGDEARATDNTHAFSGSPFVSRTDRPENTIAVLVLACWTIRLPIVYMDFIDAIESHSIPYLDHVRFLPTCLTRHLTKHAVQALTPHHAPKTLSLHRLVFRLANRCYDTSNIIIPALSAAPVLWRVVQECFGGTPTLYALTKRVGDVLSLGLSLQGSSTPSLSNTRGDLDSQRYDNAPPEVSVAATAVVVLKLVYGLDGKQRLPRSPEDPACAFPRLDEFLTAVKEVDRTECHVNSHRFGSRLSSLSVADLDDAALDEYLDFCQGALVDPNREAERRVIDNYFPLASGSGKPVQEEPPRLRGRGLLATKQNDGDIDILAPGEMYTVYDARDVLGNISEDLNVVVGKSARWAGVECDFLCGVVERYERRLLRWWADRRHERRGRGH